MTKPKNHYLRACFVADWLLAQLPHSRNYYRMLGLAAGAALTLMAFLSPLSSPAFANDAEPPWGVLIVGSFSKERALDAFARAQQAYADIIGGMHPFVCTTLTSRGGSRPFYRVRLGAQSLPEAERLCSQLKAAGALASCSGTASDDPVFSAMRSRACAGALMIRIAISAGAFDAIARTLPLGSVGYEAEPDAKGEMHIWIDDRQADKLAAMRGPGESYSDVILRIAGLGGGVRPVVVAALVGVLAQNAPALGSETLYCSTWNGIRTCSAPDGYVSHESQWMGVITGDDNQGNRWTTTTTDIPSPDPR